MPNTSLVQCERCGREGATPCTVAMLHPDNDDDDTTTTTTSTLFMLCPDCQAFVEDIQPLQSEDEITSDSEWLSRIETITSMANDISAMQQEVDQLRARMTERKKLLRLKVRELDDALNDVQWHRMIEEQKMSGQTAAVFWLEKYRRR